MMALTHRLTASQQKNLLDVLKDRFEKYPQRHSAIAWVDVQEKLLANPVRLWSLHEMERTGGEPDVTGMDAANRRIHFLRLLTGKSFGTQRTLLRSPGF
ncbi:MAG: hypothetical protein KatS3mg031_0894 [Chitinophagales bacterium]|nr:MAG: hypothetical protein KatS3mg031_0894 [Chitinophagales bacterium]